MSAKMSGEMDHGNRHKTCREASRSNDPAYVQGQYVQENMLSARISLHEKYSANPYGWTNWVFDQYRLCPNMRVLELGCGTGSVWREHLDRLPDDALILLTDFSDTMLDATRAALGHDPRFSFARVDIQSIPYPDASFGEVIANHMLYHVPDIAMALAEVSRVLEPGGRFYATTIGERTQQELWPIYREFAGSASFIQAKSSPFTLENGEPQLRHHFRCVDKREYPDSLIVTEPDDLIGYIRSSNAIPPEIDAGLCAAVRARFDPDGAFSITKEQGMFVCEH